MWSHTRSGDGVWSTEAERSPGVCIGLTTFFPPQGGGWCGSVPGTNAFLLAYATCIGAVEACLPMHPACWQRLGRPHRRAGGCGSTLSGRPFNWESDVPVT